VWLPDSEKALKIGLRLLVLTECTKVTDGRWTPHDGIGLLLGSGTHVVGRLGSAMRVSASFQIISRPVGRLGLG